MSDGFSKEAIAGRLGVARDTIYEWERVHDEFSDTIARGITRSQYFWETKFMEALQGRLKDYNPRMMIFIMKNRFGWRDNPEVIKEREMIEKLSKEQQSKTTEPETTIQEIVERYSEKPTPEKIN
jgi:DNA-binding XRE family transcriptional regulator